MIKFISVVDSSNLSARLIGIGALRNFVQECHERRMMTCSRSVVDSSYHLSARLNKIDALHNFVNKTNLAEQNFISLSFYQDQVTSGPKDTIKYYAR